MITQRQLNIMKSNSELRLMRIKMWRLKQEQEEELTIMAPSDAEVPNIPLRNGENDGAEAQMGIGGMNG
jgi:hypothetical protein